MPEGNAAGAAAFAFRRLLIRILHLKKWDNGRDHGHIVDSLCAATRCILYIFFTKGNIFRDCNVFNVCGVCGRNRPTYLLVYSYRSMNRKKRDERGRLRWKGALVGTVSMLSVHRILSSLPSKMFIS